MVLLYPPMSVNTIDRQRQKWAAQIQTARKSKGLSQEGLARLSGRSLSYIQKIENAAKGNEEIVGQLLAAIEAYDAPRRRKAS